MQNLECTREIHIYFSRVRLKIQNNPACIRNTLAVTRYVATWCAGRSRVKYSRVHTLHPGKLIQTGLELKVFWPTPRMLRVTNRIYMIFSGVIYMFESGRGILPFHRAASYPPIPSYFYLHALLAGALTNFRSCSREGGSNGSMSRRARSRWIHLNPVNLSTLKAFYAAQRYLRVCNPIKSLHPAALGMRWL